MGPKRRKVEEVVIDGSVTLPEAASTQLPTNSRQHVAVDTQPLKLREGQEASGCPDKHVPGIFSWLSGQINAPRPRSEPDEAVPHSLFAAIWDKGLKPSDALCKAWIGLPDKMFMDSYAYFATKVHISYAEYLAKRPSRARDRLERVLDAAMHVRRQVMGVADSEMAFAFVDYLISNTDGSVFDACPDFSALGPAAESSLNFELTQEQLNGLKVGLETYEMSSDNIIHDMELLKAMVKQFKEPTEEAVATASTAEKFVSMTLLSSAMGTIKKRKNMAYLKLMQCVYEHLGPLQLAKIHSLAYPLEPNFKIVCRQLINLAEANCSALTPLSQASSSN